MNKIFGSKPFFYLCALVTIVFSISNIIMPTQNTMQTSTFGKLAQVFTALAIIILLILFSNKHKEISKIMLTSILIVELLYFAMSIISLSYMIVGVPSLIKATEINSVNMVSQALPSLLLPIITNILFFTITLLLYINHCIINVTSNPSFTVIKFNHILIFMYLLVIIANKLISVFVIKIPVTNSFLLSNVDGFFTLLTVVATESFINKMREIRANNKSV